MVAVREVELVEGEPPPVAGRTRRPWWWVAAALVVVAALVGGQAWLDARQRAHTARFDHVAGVLLPVPAHPVVRWQVDPRDDGLLGASQIGTHLVAGYVHAGRYTVRELDRSTGGPLWTVNGAVTSDVTSGDAPMTCRPLGDAARVVCATSDPSAVPESPVSTMLLVLDADDGTLVSTRSAPVRMWSAADGHVLTATSTTTDAHVTWTLESRDAAAALTWARTLDPVAARPIPAATVDNYFPAYPVGLSATGDRVLLSDQGHVWVLDGGRVTSQRDVHAGTYVSLLTSGVVQVNPPSPPDAATDPGSTLVLLDGSERHVDGWPLAPEVDDGSAAGLVLVQQTPERFAALDARTGHVRWTLPVTNIYTGLVLGGTLYLGPTSHQGAHVEGPTVDAVDLRTGQTRWSRSVISTGALATDGRAVYVVGTASMQAFAIDDGATLPSVTVAGVEPTPGTDTDTSGASWGPFNGLLIRSTWDEPTSTPTVNVLG